MKLPAALGNLVLLGLVVLTSTPTNDLISDFFGYLPNLLLALGIVATSYLLAGFLLRSVLIGAVNAHMSHASAIARAVRAAVLISGFAVALEHSPLAERWYWLLFRIPSEA